MMRRTHGFTLTELLIALAILGVIATFTIPKVLSSQQDGRFKAIGKETAGMISGAYSAYKLNNQPSSAFKPSDLTPYMNYIKIDSTSIVDGDQGAGVSLNCSASPTCLRLHNGAMMNLYDGETFGGTGSTNFIWYGVDPDGKVTDGTTNGPGHMLWLILYYDGKIGTWGTLLPGATSSAGSGFYSANPAKDPPWFSWN